jgi:heme-degrading monooxygenase HmoA
MPVVVEVVRFRLAEGASESSFLEENRKAQAFVAEQPGFVGREIARGDDGGWLVLVRWRSAADADASFSKFVAAAETQPFMALLDGPSMQAGRYTVVHS